MHRQEKTPPNSSSDRKGPLEGSFPVWRVGQNVSEVSSHQRNKEGDEKTEDQKESGKTLYPHEQGSDGEKWKDHKIIRSRLRVKLTLRETLSRRNFGTESGKLQKKRSRRSNNDMKETSWKVASLHNSGASIEIEKRILQGLRKEPHSSREENCKKAKGGESETGK